VARPDPIDVFLLSLACEPTVVSCGSSELVPACKYRRTLTKSENEFYCCDVSDIESAPKL